MFDVSREYELEGSWDDGMRIGVWHHCSTDGGGRVVMTYDDEGMPDRPGLDRCCESPRTIGQIEFLGASLEPDASIHILPTSVSSPAREVAVAP
ncbi:MAG: hypothetical protein M3Y87_02430 [Myxococcota bacterium]|nr:hypothetical protein [Myxococcota bacterium]